MRRIALIAVLSLAVPALAQNKPAAAPETSKPAAQQAEKPKPMARKHGPKHGEDARHTSNGLFDMASTTFARHTLYADHRPLHLGCDRAPVAGSH